LNTPRKVKRALVRHTLLHYSSKLTALGTNVSKDYCAHKIVPLSIVHRDDSASHGLAHEVMQAHTAKQWHKIHSRRHQHYCCTFSLL